MTNVHQTLRDHGVVKEYDFDCHRHADPALKGRCTPATYNYLCGGGGCVSSNGPGNDQWGSRCPHSVNQFPANSAHVHDGNVQNWDSARAKITSWYSVTMTELGYQMELVNHGPFSVAFTVYGDFGSMWGGLDPAYTGSRCDLIYYHRSGSAGGGHGVTLVGFGRGSNWVSHASYTGYLGPKMKSLKYWLLQNSWGNSWNCNGMFKMLRGTNEARIESWGAVAVNAEISGNIFHES